MMCVSHYNYQISIHVLFIYIIAKLWYIYECELFSLIKFLILFMLEYYNFLVWLSIRMIYTRSTQSTHWYTIHVRLLFWMTLIDIFCTYTSSSAIGGIMLPRQTNLMCNPLYYIWVRLFSQNFLKKRHVFVHFKVYFLLNILNFILGEKSIS